MKSTYDQLVSKMDAEIKRGEMTISDLQGKLTVNMVERILFDSGKAEIKPAGMKVLRRVGDILKGVQDKAIQVEGHTDNVPISSRLRNTFPEQLGAISRPGDQRRPLPPGQGRHPRGETRGLRFQSVSAGGRQRHAPRSVTEPPHPDRAGPPGGQGGRAPETSDAGVRLRKPPSGACLPQGPRSCPHRVNAGTGRPEIPRMSGTEPGSFCRRG